MNKSEPNIQCSHETLNLDNSSKKTKFKKIFLISNSTLDELFNDTTHISLRWIYWSAKIHGTKKNPFEYIAPPPPQVGSEQTWHVRLLGANNIRPLSWGGTNGKDPNSLLQRRANDFKLQSFDLLILVISHFSFLKSWDKHLILSSERCLTEKFW